MFLEEERDPEYTEKVEVKAQLTAVRSFPWAYYQNIAAQIL